MNTPKISIKSNLFYLTSHVVFFVLSAELCFADPSSLSLPKDTWQLYSKSPSELVLLVIPSIKNFRPPNIKELRKQLKTRSQRKDALKLVSAEVKITRKHPKGSDYQKDFTNQVGEMLKSYELLSQEPIEVERIKNEDGGELISVHAVFHDLHYFILNYGDQRVVLTGLFSSMRPGEHHLQEQRVFKDFFSKLSQAPWNWPGWPSKKE